MRSSRATLREVPVAGGERAGGLGPGERTEAVAAARHELAANRVVGEHAIDRRGEAVVVGGLDEQRGSLRPGINRRAATMGTSEVMASSSGKLKSS
jgi:hypothetical protein